MKMAILGFGVVGQGLAEILAKQCDKTRQQTGMAPKVVAISDFKIGSLYDPNGLDLDKVLNLAATVGSLDDYRDSATLVRGLDAMTTILQSNADVIVEATFTDIKTGEPAITHCKTAFAAKKHVVMTNKGPIAMAYKQLSELAAKNGVYLGFEGTVMSGTPALRLAQTALIGNVFTEINGILNGTTNYMLTKMENGMSYHDALKQAQEKGYAEADPTSDVEGYDALYKIVILANTVMGEALTPDDVERVSLKTLSAGDIQTAKQQGKRWKMLGTIRRTVDGVKAAVKPMLLDSSHPLSSIDGATNAITYSCDLAGDITLTGAGAGKKETGYALLSDLVHCHFFMQENRKVTNH